MASHVAEGRPRGERPPGRPLGLALICVLVAVAALAAYLTWYVHSSQDALRAQQQAFLTAQHQERAAQQKQAALIDEKLCTTLGRLAALRPPAGDPEANPSRAYDQSLHEVLSGLGPDIECGK